MSALSAVPSSSAVPAPPAAASPAAARFERVTYRYPNQDQPALSRVELEIRPGLTLVAGDSGGGKSTLLRLLNGLVPQFHGGRISGRARVAGLDPFRDPVPRLAQRAGLVFQDVETQSVYGTVEREIAFGLENLGLSRAAMADRIDEAVASLGIEHLRGRSLATLSGGERQRVALAAVLVLRPEIVALDEPTSQLDPDGAAAVLVSCRTLAAAGHAVVVAEHRLETVGPASDRAVRIEAGRAATSDGPLPAPVARPAARRPSRHSRPGEPAWALHDVSAGPAGEPVLAGVNLSGSRGEVMALAGPNGSGKTTLLRTIAGLLAPLSGSVSRPDGRTAYLPQNPGALLHLPSVRAEVELTLRRTGSEGAPEPLLAAMGLTDLADRYPRDLSSGQRQRAALAAVLAGSPDLALLDEPTRGMDAAARRSLAAAVGELTAHGSAVVLATHDSELIAALADRVVELGNGRAVARGPAPAHREAAR